MLPSGRVVRIFAHLPPTLDEMFDKWIGEASPVANVNLPETRLTMPNQDMLIEATFKPIPEGDFALTVRTDVPESDARVRSKALNQLAAYRTTQTPRPGQWAMLQAPAAPEGMVFAAWTGQTAYIDDVTNPKTRMYMPDHDVTVVATYREIEDVQRYQVLYNANQGDNPPEDSGRYPRNARVVVQGPGSLTRDGYAFMAWHDRPNRDEARLDDRDYLPGDVFLMPAENKTLYAQWISRNEREALVRTGCLDSCHHTPEEFDGLRMARAQWEDRIDEMILEQGVVLDGLDSSVVSDYLAEYYSPPTHTVTPSAGDNGSIDPDTPQPVEHAETTTFTVTPDTGYTASVAGTCGGTLEGDTFTTNPITADCTVEATFSVDQAPEPIPTLSQWGMILLAALVLVTSAAILGRRGIGSGLAA